MFRLNFSCFTTIKLLSLSLSLSIYSPFLTPHHFHTHHSHHITSPYIIIGVLLMGGQGIAKNEMDAVKYYSMAARQGYEPAIEALRMVDEMESIS